MSGELGTELEKRMKTAKEREVAFREDLAGLLELHGAVLTVTDDGKPFWMQSGVCKITMQSLWDKDNNQLADYAEFDL